MSEGINKILRSLLVFNDKPDQENAARNFEQVLVYRIDFTEDEEKEIFNKIKNHFSVYRETPTIQDLRDAFELEKNPGAILVLDEVSKEPCYVRSSFEALVMGELEKQRIAKIHILAKESAHIASHGLKIGKVELRGVNDAIRHFTGGADSLLVTNNGVRLSGDITQDHDDFMEEVEYTHTHPEEAYGCLTGIVQVDEGCMGVKPSEFWAHAAYSGGLKTTFALNWAYFTAVFLKKNVEYFSLEMPYKQVRRILKVMHSTHWKFTDAPSEGGLGWEPLEYKKVRDGKLTPIELERLEYISKDLSNQELYGAIHVVKPDREITMADLRFMAEAQHKKTPLSIIFIDYLQLVQSSDKTLRSTVERQNEVARAGKHLAMNFNGGAGVSVVGLWQINNEGYKHAQKKMESKEEKKGSVYDLSHLSWANELKNAADYVTYTYVDDDLRAANEAIIGNMKNRDNSIFPEARMRVEWGQRKLESLVIVSPQTTSKSFETTGVKDIDIDAVLNSP